MFLNDHKFDICTLSETWLKNNKHQVSYVQIPGYNFEHRSRSGRRGGGVACYIQENISYKVRNDLNKIEPSFEHLWIQCNHDTPKTSFLVGTFYQPNFTDNEKRDWLEKFEGLLSKVSSKWKGYIFITGDFNIDLKSSANHISTQYTDILHTFDLVQHINQPTRNSNTLIDHISSNAPNRIVSTGIIPCDEISDHDAAYVTIKKLKSKNFEKRYKWIRDMKNFNLESYIRDAQELPFNLVYAFDDPEDQLDIFNHILTECIEKHAPLKRTLITRPPAPWMKNKEIVTLKSNLRSARASKDVYAIESLFNYRKVRSDLKKCIKKVKKAFYQKALSSKKPKEIWSTIYRILNPPEKRITANPETLNNHFATMATRLTGASATEIDMSRYNSTVHQHHQFSFSVTSYSEVYKNLLLLRNDCSTGPDGIPVKFLKPIVDVLASPLTSIINNCIKKETFPQQWKKARVHPIPKIDKALNPTDFRPISILPSLSKVYERVLLKQLCTLIEKEQLYAKTQSGFRKGHSCESLLIKFKDDITKAMKKGEITLAVAADYSKAFDTICYQKLLDILHTLGLSKSAITIIKSYLSERTQYVSIDDKSSSVKNVTFGVPQGSILGPVLFNLYVSDLSNQTENRNLQYADDTTIYTHCKVSEINNGKKSMEKDLSTIQKWSNERNLLLNPKKTAWLLFATSQMSQRHKLKELNLSLQCANETITRKDSIKLLGVTFCENLTWNHHVADLVKTSFGTLSVLRKLKNLAPFHVRKSLAECMILSRMDYSSSVFRSMPEFLQKRLQKLQNSAASFVTGRYNRTKDVLRLKWLPVKERFDFSTVKLIFKTLNDANSPSYLQLKRYQATRVLRSTASRENTLTTNENGTFQAQATKVFNELPINIRNEKCKIKFISLCRKHFFDKAEGRLANAE